MVEFEEFENIWDAIEESPEEAAKMKVLSQLMMQMLEIIAQHSWNSAEAAERFHTSPDRIGDLLSHRIDRLHIDDLLEMAGALGREVRVEIQAA